MKNKILYSVLFLLMFCTCHTYAQSEPGSISVSSIVSDTDGNPVENVEIFSDPAYAKTGADGQFTISVSPDALLIIKANGYQTVKLLAGDVQNMSNISLASNDLLYGKKINLAFRQSYQGDLTGAVTYVDADEILKYDETGASGLLSNRTLGMLGSNQIRGLGVNFDVGNIMTVSTQGTAAMVVVDGIPRELTYLRASEIESITVLKDANAAVLYGTAAANGVILVTTKRGEAYKKQADFKVTYGINKPMAFPKFLNSADYMEYYNQARRNDQLDAVFTDIDNYRSGDPYRYPNVDYFSRDYLRPFYRSFNAEGQFSGGNSVAKYYSNFGWNNQNTIYSFGEGKDSRTNEFHARLNGDLKINSWINTRLDGSVTFQNQVVPRISASDGYWAAARSIRPYEYTPLIPIDLIEPDNPVLESAKRIIDGKYLLGGSDAYRTTPIGDMYGAGESEIGFRNFSLGNQINFDFNQWIEGLTLNTNFGFDFWSGFSTTVANIYATYFPTFDNNNRITGLQKFNADEAATSPLIEGIALRRRFGYNLSLQYDKMFDDIHHITAILLGYGNTYKQSGDLQGSKFAHLGLHLGYIYNKRYMIDFSSAYVNSTRLAPGHRGGFSPTAGLAWVMSSEEFMSSADFIDYLKIRFSAGIIKSDLMTSNNSAPGYFWYDDNYGGSTSWGWGDGLRSRSSTIANRTRNFDMTFAERKDLNLGFESLLFGNRLGLEANYFLTLNEGMLVRSTNEYPSFLGTFVPYENFENVKYQGFELGASYAEKWNDLSLRVGANLLYSVSVKTKVNELRAYPHLNRVGTPHDGYWGLVSLGFFENQADVDNSTPQVFGGTVREGDLKYQAQKENGRIDTDDEVLLGRWQAPWSGGINFTLSYKKISLFVIGEGRSGAKPFKENNYFWLEGTRKYSEVALNSWTPETRNTAVYPRLSSQSNPNNNRRSTFWQYNADYFEISKIQLNYQMPELLTSALHMKSLDVFAYVTRPLILAKEKEMRLIQTGNSGGLNYRSFVFGLKVSF